MKIKTNYELKTNLKHKSFPHNSKVSKLSSYRTRSFSIYIKRVRKGTFFVPETLNCTHWLTYLSMPCFSLTFSTDLPLVPSSCFTVQPTWPFDLSLNTPFT